MFEIELLSIATVCKQLNDFKYCYVIELIQFFTQLKRFTYHNSTLIILYNMHLIAFACS